MAQPPKPLSKDCTNHEPFQITATHPLTDVPVNFGYVAYPSNVFSNNLTQNVAAYPTHPQVPVVSAYNNLNARGAVNPTLRPPYVIATRRGGCQCNWKISVTAVAFLSMLIGSILLGVGLSNCADFCYYDLYVTGGTLLAIGTVMAICILVAFLVRCGRVTTTTMQHY
ncbi:7841_t:CDS:1 [Paraglomus occultum]|uniref:7841_t:CDS:1 n=1 Tax=Paraglomus occultum TaxID=144539 RepID=A0A9N9G0H5_9GLOM|nr:7841_t:CDS:1 [Paraglomus occultum]